MRYFSLGLQGYAAQYQGWHEDAARFFTEAEAMELPSGTYRVIQTATARMAFQLGDRSRAYRTLRDNLDVLLDTDYTDVTRMVAVEFITMVGVIDRLADAAHVLTYLDTTGDYGTLARENLAPTSPAGSTSPPTWPIASAGTSMHTARWCSCVTSCRN